MSYHETILWEQKLSHSAKQLQVCCGDICESSKEFDIVVCSAFKNSYFPSHGSLIRSLWKNKLISVSELSKNPEVNLNNMGCWISKKISYSNIHRVMCVEFSWNTSFYSDTSILKDVFFNLRHALEYASLRGISVKHIALPLLGTGNQGIEPSYIAVPLINQCLRALESIDELESITFYECSYDKAVKIAHILESMSFDVKDSSTYRTNTPSVFISYSSTQAMIAHQIYQYLESHGVSCWIAPESVPAGSNYMDEIPKALNQVKVLLLLLTPEAEKSPWVCKEVATAIGSGKTIIPYQLYNYSLSERFHFLLTGEQIHFAFQYHYTDVYSNLLEIIRKNL